MRASPILGPALVLAAAGALASGCSALGLDRFQFPACGECNLLNDRDGIDEETACELWQCDETTLECMLGPRDRDQDMHPPVECGGDDCDDAVPTTFGDAPESCNGVDDDCDGWVDDDATGMLEDPVAIFGAASPAWVDAEDVAEGLAVAYATEGGGGFEIVRGPTAIETLGDALELASTSAPFAFETSATAAGCARAVPTPHPQSTCGAGGTCMGGQQCFTSRGGDMLCGAPLLGSPPPDTCNAHVECDDGSFCNGIEECLPGNPASDAFGCRAATASGCAEGELCHEETRSCVVVGAALVPCAIDDLSVASVSGEWLAAAISDAPCGDGALRLGHFVDEARTPATRFPLRTIAQRGDAPGARSTSWLGVGLDTGQTCVGPGNGRADGAPRGAAAPAIAALPADPANGRLRPQALVATLAAPSCRTFASCGASGPVGSTGPVEIELIGAWIEQGSAGGASIGWVNGSARAATGLMIAGTARRPAITSWSSGAQAGYLVAVPAEGGGIGIVTSLALSDPAAVCGMPMMPPCVVGSDPYPTHLDSDARRVAPALVAPDVGTIFTSAAPTGDVSIAMGADDGGPIDVVLAWAEASDVVLAHATIDPASGAVTEGEVERFAASGASDVAVAHLVTGLARPDEDVSPTGGFVLTWRTAESTSAVRIADRDGSAIAPGVISLGRTSRFPRAFVGEDGRARVLAHQAGSFVVFPSICGVM